MKKFIYTITIASFLLAISMIANGAFSDATSAPNGTNNASGPVDASDENQSKNATLTLKSLVSGVTNRAVQIDSLGNVSVYATSGPSTAVRMIVDGDIYLSTLAGSTSGEICSGNTNGSEEDGYPLVRC